MNIVLIPGMWLSGSVWEPVTGHLTSLGHRATALTLPGQGDGDPSATLDDQVSAVVAAVDAAPAGQWSSGTRRPAPWPGWRPTGGRTPSGLLCWWVAFRRRTVSCTSPPSHPSTVDCRSPAGSPSRDPTPPTSTNDNEPRSPHVFNQRPHRRDVDAAGAGGRPGRALLWVEETASDDANSDQK